MEKIREDIITKHPFVYVDDRIVKFLKNKGCSSPFNSCFYGYVRNSDRFFRKHNCFKFSSRISERYENSLYLITHYLLSDYECKGENVICTVTRNFASDIFDVFNIKYIHSFYSHKIGECPYCEYERK